ncbi:MAG: rRNA maturation RNase YbeY, partial [Gemmatimonadota bacterium]|nr:rRNA maturation RNase YbeY [Gemmatimonadota bacterium]
MTRVVAVESDGVRVGVSRDRVRRVAEHVLRAERVREAMVSITFVSDRRIAALNARHLKHRGPTDVISFGFVPVWRGGAVVGDVYVAPDVARRNARSHGQGVREELLRLVVHGVLHVLGHDHPMSDARYASPMWRRQERLLRAAMAAA